MTPEKRYGPCYIRTKYARERRKPLLPLPGKEFRVSLQDGRRSGHLEMRRATPPRRRVGPPFRHELLRLRHCDDD